MFFETCIWEPIALWHRWFWIEFPLKVFNWRSCRLAPRVFQPEIYASNFHCLFAKQLSIPCQVVRHFSIYSAINSISFIFESIMKCSRPLFFAPSWRLNDDVFDFVSFCWTSRSLDAKGMCHRKGDTVHDIVELGGCFIGEWHMEGFWSLFL